MADETDKPSKPWGEKKENGYMISYFKDNTEPTTEKINQKNEKKNSRMRKWGYKGKKKMELQRKEVQWPRQMVL